MITASWDTYILPVASLFRDKPSDHAQLDKCGNGGYLGTDKRYRQKDHAHIYNGSAPFSIQHVLQPLSSVILNCSTDALLRVFSQAASLVGRGMRSFAYLPLRLLEVLQRGSFPHQSREIWHYVCSALAARRLPIGNLMVRSGHSHQFDQVYVYPGAAPYRSQSPKKNLASGRKLEFLGLRNFYKFACSALSSERSFAYMFGKGSAAFYLPSLNPLLEVAAYPITTGVTRHGA